MRFITLFLLGFLLSLVSSRPIGYPCNLSLRDLDDGPSLCDTSLLSARGAEDISAQEWEENDLLALRNNDLAIQGDAEALYETLLGREPKVVDLARSAVQKIAKGWQAANPKRKPADLAKYAAAAAQKHRATIGMPSRNEQFKIEGHGTISGKDIRKAVFDSHVEAEVKKKEPTVKSPLKTFFNRPHKVPKSDDPSDQKSISSMKGHGKEFPIYTASREKGPARIITQLKAGVTWFKGVVAHDPSRPKGSKGYSDHFQVWPTRPSSGKEVDKKP